MALLYFCSRQSHHSCLIPLTNSQWVTALFLCQACLIPWPTGSECIAVFLFQAASPIMAHPMTNSMWVTVLYIFASQPCLIPWPTGSEWHCFNSLPGSFINHVSSHDQQLVSDTAVFLCQAVSLIMSLSMITRMWVTLLYFFATWQFHQSCLFPWPTGCEWHCLISLPGTLITHVSSYDQQLVSDTALFLCQAVSSIMSLPMTNRMWVTLLYFFARQSH